MEVTVKGVMPTSNGCAIFLGNEDKTFVIYVDPVIGNAINMTINELLEVLKEKGWDGEGYISKKEVIDTKEKEEVVDDEDKEGSEGGIGAGVGFEESGGLIKTISSDSNQTEPCSNQDSSEEEECYTLREIDGIEYQINKEDYTVIRITDLEIVGVWDHETEEITFNENE